MSLGRERGCREEDIIMGVDILPGKSVSSRKQPHYALVILRNGELLTQYEDVSLSRLIRLTWEYRPKAIAVDNVYELAQDYNGLVKIASMLPPDTRIVQVTGWGPEALNTRSLARLLGIPVHGRLTPLKTAYVAAIAVYKGYGYTIKLLEEKTKIIVSRGRSVSHGGMSYNRFVRSVRASILNVTREIKKILDKNKLDYDLVFRKSRGGLEGSVFIVYAPRSRVRSLVKPIETKTVKVEIRPVYAKKVAQEPLRQSLKPVIVGIDPGISTGLAVIDLNGSPLLLYSSKNIDRSDIVYMVSSIGKPVLIATDVSSPPDSIKKLAATLGVQIYAPPRDLSSDEKNNIVYNIVLKKYPWIDIEDTHERDALAAAYKAYMSYENKFRQLEVHLNSIGLELDLEEAKADVIKGLSIAEAIEKQVEKKLEETKSVAETTKKSSHVEEKPRIDEKTLGVLREKIRVLEAEKKKLLKTIESLENRVRELEIELKSIRKTISPDENLLREISMLKLENQRLSRENSLLREKIEALSREKQSLIKAIETIVSNRYITVPVYQYITSIDVNELVSSGYRLVYIRNPETYSIERLRELRSHRIAMLVDKVIEYPVKIPVVSIKKYKHYLIGGRVYVEPRIIGDVENIWKTLEAEEKEREYEKIIRLIEEYKKERKKRLGVKEIASRTI